MGDAFLIYACKLAHLLRSSNILLGLSQLVHSKILWKRELKPLIALQYENAIYRGPLFVERHVEEVQLGVQRPKYV